MKWIGAHDLQVLRGKVGISNSRMELVPLASMVLRELVETFKPKARTF